MEHVFITEVAAGLCVALLTALVIFLYKLPRTLDKLTAFMEKTERVLHHHDKRISFLEKRFGGGDASNRSL